LPTFDANVGKFEFNAGRSTGVLPLLSTPGHHNNTYVIEKCIMKKYLRLGTLAILSASTPFIAHADTLTLEATSGVLNPSGTAYIYPYSFSINVSA
jgi:hypothetical protein